MNEPPESELQQLPPLFGLSADDSALNLTYLFQSDPERIRITPPGGDSRTVNLRIMISNPRVDPVVLEKIAIAFPLEQRYIEPFWSAPTRLRSPFRGFPCGLLVSASEAEPLVEVP